MEKQLELYFLTEMGRTVRIVVHDPKDDLTEEEIETAMQTIIDANAFYTAGGELVASKEARLVERNVIVYDFEQ